MNYIKFLIIQLFTLLVFCSFNVFPPARPITLTSHFQLGNEVLLKNTDKLKNKNIALITNQTGITSDGTHIIDALLENGVNIVKIFTPEHGLRGDEIYTGNDEKTGLPVISLYGEKKKPSADDLIDVDVIIYDIQDVGARFYTYTSTLYYCIDAAISSSRKLIICDRPVIINPDYVDGYILEKQFQSFVGKIPVPVCYGMTCGELANYLNDELFSSKADIEVVKMENYSRTTEYTSLNLKWVKPSPNMFYVSSAVCYPATCFLEGTNVSEGRGTEKPFEYIGAPWIDALKFASELNLLELDGINFEAIEFIPSEKISAYPPKYFGKKCNGVYLNVINKNKFQPVKTAVAILYVLNKCFSKFEFNKNNFIDDLAGTDKLRKDILNRIDYKAIIESWKEDVENFNLLRKKYLIY